MGGGSSNNDQETTLRYAPYIEELHILTLNKTVATREKIIDGSPYESYREVSANDASLGIGVMLSSFPSLYRTFGKHLSGLDIDSLFSTNMAEKLASTDDIIRTELDLIDESIEQSAEHRIASRNLNAISGSTFLIAQANIEQNRMRKTIDLRVAARYSLIPGVVDTWTTTLSWDKELVKGYARSLQNYYLCKINADEFGYKMKSDNALWAINVLDFERNMLAAMTGSRASRTMNERERSDVSKALLVASYTATGAQIGSMFPGYGTAVGAAVGFIIGMAIMLLE